MSSTARKSYLILGRLPTTPLFHQIASAHSITHLPAKSLSRADIISKISSLPSKSFTFVLVLSEAQTLYPIDKQILGPLRIECLCKVGAGYDSVDVEYLTGRGTWVANTPNAVRVPTAEWAVAMILDTVKGLNVADRNMRTGRYRDGLGLQNNIYGMTLGIVGLGAIGKEVVKRMIPWGVKVVYSNRKPIPSEDEKEFKARYVSLNELLAQSDIISLHCPLTPETHHLINAETLSQCKKGVFLINTSRGQVVDEKALINALESGQVKRAGLDVFEREPYYEKELLEIDNVVLSPHYAAFTQECMAALEQEVLENTIAYMETGKPNTPVNSIKKASL